MKYHKRDHELMNYTLIGKVRHSTFNADITLIVLSIDEIRIDDAIEPEVVWDHNSRTVDCKASDHRSPITTVCMLKSEVARGVVVEKCLLRTITLIATSLKHPRNRA